MFRNYWKIALRSLWKNKSFSALNITGLAMGLAACLLILLYVKDELSFDKYNTNADRIYRIDTDIRFGGSDFLIATGPDPLAKVLKDEFPQIEAVARFRGQGNQLFRKGTENIMEDRVIYADASIFDVFTLPVLDGNPRRALQQPNTVVITESTARKYFGKTTVAGQYLETGNRNLQIAGVIRDLPATSHFKYDFFISLETLEESRRNHWLGNNFNTYFLLKEGAGPETVQAGLRGIVVKHVAPQLKGLLNSTLDELEKKGDHIRYDIRPLTSIHLHSDLIAELGANSNVQYVYIFSAVALFILLIACVNFMNLSTARSSNRAREVGVRKVMGSLRRSLVMQFLMESIVISIVSLLLALILAWSFLPWFNQLSGKSIDFAKEITPGVGLILIGFAIVVGIIAGSYPAFFLSSFQPIKVLKGKLAAGFRTGWMRNSLVVFQFGISIFLIIGTVVIYNQLNYIRNKKTGFNREQVLIVNDAQILGNKSTLFKDEVKRSGIARDVTMTGYLPTSSDRNTDVVFKDATATSSNSVSLQIWAVDEDYVPTLGMEMAAGRNFSRDFPTDSSAVLINEAAAKIFGYTNPVGQTIYMPDGYIGSSNSPYTIVGVVKDFNFNSMRETVGPLLLQNRFDRGSVAIRIPAGNQQTAVDKVRDIWKGIAPDQPFRFTFMDEDFNRIYEAEQRTGKISLAFSILAVMIACLGLFGLAAYAAEQRTKEIGIRKVLGASVGGIVQLLSKDFLKLVFIAELIAFPFAWWAMNNWLQHFAYRSAISWWVFAGTAIVTLLIAILTVSFQAIRAALSNPVESLRNE
ncbi:ABC transporter permease [Pseudobacter ginsenosidimutans]|uniref:Putative ABC transport system permease protein n=1 Tax=Pseudobacter ginsenosidimutans TaxID=661488 RepID=A0A4Q7N5Y9_9BACT|nr:ABC transporter permease [Pseudobacter ginsenosidimutans]QEC44989.1 FtsX-like permease family protein [Pseudobacter ginsenosidimutans]RZS76483.1 putative ABC transport system permease protein [Pseudobacter ginsenosidimutans]